jgi:hypothetical protein
MADTETTMKTDADVVMRSDELRSKRLEARLRAAKKPCFEPVLETGDGAPGDAKMGGTPLGDPPVCKGCKRTMVLLLQVDPATLPEGSPLTGKGPLQVFHCGRNECDYGDTTHSPGGTGVLLRLGLPKSKAPTEDKAKKPKKAQPKAVAKGQASRIVGWKQGVDLPGAAEAKDLALDAKEARLMSEQRSRDGDKLGGYANWIQSANRPSCPTCDEPMKFVVQLSARLVDFGDSGLGYVHQCAKHPAKLAFSWSST